MNKSRAIQTVDSKRRLHDLEEDLVAAQEALRVAEAELAAEQAQINAFRMHHRLKLGPWIERLQEVQTEKQRLLTSLTMWQQAAESGRSFDPAGWLNEEEASFESRHDRASEFESEEKWEADGRPIVDPHPGDRKSEKRLYRELARRFHPDLVEDALLRSYATSMMAAVNEAYANRDVETLRDLAGELDPNVVTDLSQTGSGPNVKRLQKRLRKCRRRTRKLQIQLQMLRQEQIARLWRRAQQVDLDEGENWWDEVVEQLQAEIAKIEVDLQSLRKQLAQMNNRPPD